MRSIGVDLHKTMFVVCWLEGQEKEFERYELQEIDRFKSRLRKTDRVALEATGNARYFVEQIRASVSEVKVANPRQFRVISHSVKKTDREDAEMLAVFLAKDMLPEVTMKDDQRSQLIKKYGQHPRSAGKAEDRVKEQDS